MQRPSVWRAWYDLGSARMILGLMPGAAERLSAEDHRWLAASYATLAAHWRRWGWRARAVALEATAAEHVAAAGDDDLPPAAAMGLGRRRYVVTEARGSVVKGPW